jgi:hypothetical protein
MAPVTESVHAKAGRPELEATQTIRLVMEMRTDSSVSLVMPRWVKEHRGTLAVWRSDTSVAVFDSSGHLVGEVGRPGEFGVIASAGWVGDSLWVYDIVQTRTMMYSPSLATTRVQLFDGILPRPVAFYAGGMMLLQEKVPAVAAPDAASTMALVRRNSTGTTNQYVATIPPVGSNNIHLQMGDVSTTLRAPIAVEPAQVISSEGNRIATLTTQFEGNPSNVIHLVMQSSSGDTIYVRNIPFTPDSIPPAVIEAAKSRLLSSAPRDTMRQRQIREQTRLPAAYSPFTDLLISDDGVAWIQLRHEVGNPQRSMVLDSLGRVIGIATLPLTIAPVAVTSKHMWALEKSPNGFVRIVRYGVTPVR